MKSALPGPMAQVETGQQGQLLPNTGPWPHGPVLQTVRPW